MWLSRLHELSRPLNEMCSPICALSPILAHQFRLRYHSPLHRMFEVTPAGTGFQVEFRVERIEAEEITMGFPGRRARSAIADALEVVLSLAGSVVEGIGFGPGFRQSFSGGNVPDNPVGAGAHGCVGIIRDERK